MSNNCLDIKKEEDWIDYILNHFDVKVYNDKYEHVKKCYINAVEKKKINHHQSVIPLLEGLKRRKVEINDMKVPSGFYCKELYVLFNMIGFDGGIKSLTKALLNNSDEYKDLKKYTQKISDIIYPNLLYKEQIKECFNNWIQERKKYRVVDNDLADILNKELSSRDVNNYITAIAIRISKNIEFSKLNDKINKLGGYNKKKRKSRKKKVMKKRIKTVRKH